MENKDLQPEDALLASSSTLLYRIEARKMFLVFIRKFPPQTREIKYTEIASVEHRRLLEYSLLIRAIIPVVVIMLLHYVTLIKDIISQLIVEVGQAMGTAQTTAMDPSVRSAADQVLSFVSWALLIIAVLEAARFLLSLQSKLIIYRSGKNAIAIPMPLTGNSMEVLAKVNEKVEKIQGVSKSEVQQIINEQIRSLIDERMKMQYDLITSMKREVQLAKTVGDNDRVRQIVQAGIDKLEAHDLLIDQQLRKTGLTKEDLFKKYRIKSPKEEFINSVLRDEGLEYLLNK